MKEMFSEESLDKLKLFFENNFHGDVDGLKKDVSILIEQARMAIRYREALVAIASFDESETVNGSFDEPGSAQMARDVLV